MLVLPAPTFFSPRYRDTRLFCMRADSNIESRETFDCQDRDGPNDDVPFENL